MNTLRYIGISLTILLLLVSVFPILYADAYARKIYCFGDVTFDNCPKWSEDKIKNLTIVVIDRLGSDIHTQLVIDAIQTWRYYIPIFNYTLSVEKEYKPADIAIYIDDRSLCSFGATPCAAGTTVAYGDEHSLKSAMVSMGRDGCLTTKYADICQEFNLQLFYRLALHEFGHVLGLGHSVRENNKFPVDIMDAKALDPNAQITIKDIAKLTNLYGHNSYSPMPDCEKIDWILCFYVEGRINNGWHDSADVNMLEYDNINNCASWYVTLPTHNIDEYNIHVVFWNEDKVVALAYFNITQSQEVDFCTSEKTDDAQLGMY